jgi:hypothetical protein
VISVLEQPVLSPATATTTATEASFVAAPATASFSEPTATLNQVLTLVNESFQADLTNVSGPPATEPPQQASGSTNQQQQEPDKEMAIPLDIAAAAAAARFSNGLNPVNPAVGAPGSGKATLNQGGGLAGAADRAVPLSGAQAVQSAASSEQQNNPQAVSQLTPEAGGSADLGMPSVAAMQNSLRLAKRAGALTTAP